MDKHKLAGVANRFCVKHLQRLRVRCQDGSCEKLQPVRYLAVHAALDPPPPPKNLFWNL